RTGLRDRPHRTGDRGAHQEPARGAAMVRVPPYVSASDNCCDAVDADVARAVNARTRRLAAAVTECRRQGMTPPAPSLKDAAYSVRLIEAVWQLDALDDRAEELWPKSERPRLPTETLTLERFQEALTRHELDALAEIVGEVEALARDGRRYAEARRWGWGSPRGYSVGLIRRRHAPIQKGSRRLTPRRPRGRRASARGSAR